MQEFKKTLRIIWDFSIILYIFGVIFFALRNNLLLFIISTILLITWFAWGRVNFRVKDGERLKVSTLFTGLILLAITIWIFLLGKCINNLYIQDISGYLIFGSAIIMFIGIMSEKKEK